VEQHRAHVGVECPQCHFRQFMEVDSDLEATLKDSQVTRKIFAELQAWMLSRCPDHLRAIAGMSKN
jgi:hypothetical protein